MFKVTCSLTERQLKAILRRAVFPGGRLHCPRCRSFKIRKVAREDRYHCPRCRRKFSLLSGTWLKSAKVPLTTLIILLHAWKEEYTIKQTGELTELSVPTIRRYFRLFRQHIVKAASFEPLDNVQVDEAYFGRFKKLANYYHGVRTYRVVQKTCVAGIACPTTGKLAAKVINGKPGKPIKQFIRQLVPEDVTIYSDGSNIYKQLGDTHQHLSQTHDLGFHNAAYIESCWSWMKRKLFRQYHHFWRKNAEAYVSELTWRFNTRNKPENTLTYLQKSL